MRQLVLAARLARRELRGGIRRFGIVIAALALGVGIIAGVGSLSAAIEAGFAADARAILGGDAELRLAYREADATERNAMEAGGRVSHAMEMRAMVKVADPDVAPTLAEVKSVDDAYPLYGALELEPAVSLAAALAPQTDGLYGAVLEPTLADRLGVKVGDAISVGSATFHVAALVTYEPDRGLRGFSLGPRLMLRPEALAETGLLQPGALVYHLYRIAYAEGVDGKAFLDGLRSDLPKAGWRIRELKDANSGAKRFIDRTAQFLNVVGFAALLIGGIGIANAVRAYLESRAQSLAILRCVGATSSLLFMIYGMQVLAMTLVGVLVGLAIGVALPYAAQSVLAGYGLRLLPGLYAAPMLFAAAVGLLTASSFALLPLLRAQRVRPAQLFRALSLELGAMKRIDLVPLALIGVALAGLILLGSNDRMLGFYFILAALGALALFRLLAMAIHGAAARLRARGQAAGWPQAIRFALGAMVRPQSPAAGIVVSLGLGLTVLVAVGLIQRGLTQDIRETLPQQAPSFYFIDIQPGQLAEFGADVGAFPSSADFASVPMLRGRVARVNDVPSEEVEADPNVAWVLRGDRGVTWSAERPANANVVEGEWWPANYQGEPLVSLDVEAARGLGLGVGDTITVNILGREIGARIANLREIDWAHLDINFVMIFSPGLIGSAPQTHIATVRVDPERESELVKVLAAKYPNVSAIRVKDAISTATRILEAVGVAVRTAAGIALIVGALVLAGAMATGQQRRIYEAVLLKMLGGTRRDVALGYVTEFAFLATLSAGLALVIGSIGAWAFLTRVMESSWTFDPPLALGILGVALVLALGLGFAGSWRALGARAAPYLRNE
ncbi:putative ABC transport system permease protein [Dongia mobilis]|uniref:Putative ABC transport system permease protein n=1 Tax=Dongia mobilis TaxID=578943 RepID=A0A4R6WRT6_9PROT|nr:FtsX-like permease family protein [Dongia mobilis]TDQ84315.1 putative ABC transport system permease protein [Dongia mobilis]